MTLRHRFAAISTAVLTGLLSVLPALSSGCGDQEAGIRVSMPASRRPDVDDTAVARGALIIPHDKAFNYPKFRSGQEGRSARGEAKAVGNDGALCRAEVGDEGDAWGEFALAYCFDNLTGKALDAVIKARLTIRRTVTRGSGQGDVVKPAETTANLSFIVEDASMGQVLRQEQLISGEVDLGPQLSTTHRDLVFDVKFEPDRGYYLILSGRAGVTAEQAGQSGAVLLEVRDVSFEIQWLAAEGAAEAGDAAGSTGARAAGATIEPAATTPMAADE